MLTGKVKRGIILWMITILLISQAASVVPVYAEEEHADELSLYAQSAVLMDAGSGRILYEKDGQEKRPMASTTKIMTCILALENGNLEDYVMASKKAASMPKVKLGMKEGEYFKLKDLLYSLMLESHNDTAVAIAEHIGGSIQGFADMMNKKAQELSCPDTYFITPNGLDAETQDADGNSRIHSTTAEDLARIMSYCINFSPQKEAFLEITRTEQRSFQGYRKVDESYEKDGRSYSCTNHNAFLNMMDGALSGKTGFTGKAGYCYVGSLRQGERTFVVSLLACGWPNNKTYKWKDTKTLMRYGLENFEYHEIEEVELKQEELPSVRVEKVRTRTLDGICELPVEIEKQQGVSDGILLKKDENIEVRKQQNTSLIAPVRKGCQVGTIAYLLNGELLREDRIVVSESADAIDYKWCLNQVIKRFIL